LHAVWAAIVAAMNSWHQGKLFIEHTVTIAHETLHVLVGTFLWVVFGLLMRKPLSSWMPWLSLFAVILWNETVDLWLEQWPDPGQQYGEGAKDIIVTMIVPTLLLFAIRARPDLFRQTARRRRR
jgi:hypothetical protein